MENEIRRELMELLSALERELRRIDAWETVPPAPERLASEVPFSHDTLEFTQWVQWIFIPRLRAVLEGGHILPSACAIAPVAEIAFADHAADTDPLLEHLRRIDSLISGRGHADRMNS